MITEDYVSFETAKLLKENGFDEECRAYYVKSKECGIELFPTERSHNYNDNVYPRTSAPTLQMAMKWLREVHHYYIQIMLDNWVGIHVGYFVIIMKTDSDFGLQLYDEEEQVFYETPEKASEAAIKYSLENLI